MADEDKKDEAQAVDAPETPKEIVTAPQAQKLTPAQRAAAMAAENASTSLPAGSRDPKGRDARAARMASENAASVVPMSDDERNEKKERAAQMAEENAVSFRPVE